MSNNSVSKIFSAVLCAGALIGFVGCGGPKYEMVQASGKAAFTDGKTLPEGTMLMFSPASGGSGSAMATLGADGSFELTHQNGKKGAEVGKYAVEVRPPKNAGSDFWKQLPEQYASGSFTTVEISKGMSPLDIKLSKEETK